MYTLYIHVHVHVCTVYMYSTYHFARQMSAVEGENLFSAGCPKGHHQVVSLPAQPGSQHRRILTWQVGVAIVKTC